MIGVTMSKKILFIVAGILLGAGTAVGTTSIFNALQNSSEGNQTQTSSGPGTPLANDATPEYKTCELVSKEVITATFSAQQTGEREGVTAVNNEPAEVCRFDIMKDRKEADLLLMTYTNSPVDNKIPDNSWINISTLELTREPYVPTYFKSITVDGITRHTLRVLGAAKSYEFVIEQSVDVFDSDTARIELLKLANVANLF